MGWFVLLEGKMTCVRCAKTSVAQVQTKLLRSEMDNSCHVYRVGDRELIDGLEDFMPLFSWHDQSQLVIGISDWDCDHCGLAWQWSKAVFDISFEGGKMFGKLREMTDLPVVSAQDLKGIHFVCDDLAEMARCCRDSTNNGSQRFSDWWHHLFPEQRCEFMAMGIRAWRREVAGLN